MKILFAVAAVVVLAGSAAAAVSTPSSSDDPRQLMRAISANDGKSYPIARTLGGDPAKAMTIGKTSRGVTLSVTPSREGRCVLFSDGNEFCATDDQISGGQSSSVGVDCARARGDVDITVVTPEGTATAVVAKSDGSTVAMQLASNVAWLDTQAPTASEAAYIAVQALDAQGRLLSEGKLPSNLCPGG